MTAREFKERLDRRARRAQLTVPEGLYAPLQKYVLLLSRWNLKINLTALPLDPPTDETFDRLLVEPLAAARHIGQSVVRWVDVGSGGGSPAIPLKIACPTLILSMVESKTRKAAFLREAIRAIPLESASVENRRFEDLVDHSNCGTIDLITARAVRPDEAFTTAARALLSSRGRLFLFRTGEALCDLRGFQAIASAQLLGKGAGAFLGIYEPNVPRGTNS